MHGKTRITLTSIAFLIAARAPALADRRAPVKYEDGDPDEVSSIVSSLERMSKGIYEGGQYQIDDYKNNALGVANYLWHSPSEELRRSPKLAKLRAWQTAMEKEVLRKVGSQNATEIYGDGKRISRIDDDVAEATAEALAACESAAAKSNTGSGQRDVEAMTEEYKKYEAKLSRVMKAQPSAVRYVSNDGTFIKDYLSAFMACEWTIADKRAMFEDYYTRDESKAEKYKGCGFEEWTLSKLARGGDSYKLDGIPSVNGMPTPCSKIPRKSKLSGAIKKAALRDIPGAKQKGRVLAVYGTNTIRRGLDHYKLVGIRMWGKDIMLSTTDCGEKNPKLVCEASGSKTVFTFNAIQHYLDRADYHKDAGRSAKCKAMLGEARKSAEEWTSFYNESKKSGEWTKGLTYLTKKHGKMDEKEIVAKVEEMGQVADERSIGYCGKK